MTERLRVLLVLASVLVCAASAAAAEPDSELWYDATFDGASMGYSREWVETAADGNIVTGLYTRMIVKRRNDLVRVEVSERWTETPAGQPLEYHMITRTSERETRVDLLIEGAAATLRHAIGSDAALTQMVAPEGLLFPCAVKRLMVEHGFAPGTTYSYEGFDAESEAMATYTVTVEGSETFEFSGERVTLSKLVVSSDARPGLPVHEWRDADGVLWKYELPSAGIALVMTTKEKALAEKKAFDLLTASAVSADVAIRTPFDIDTALYELWLDDGADIADFIEEDARQVVEGRTERGVLLRVSRVTPDPANVVRFPIRSTPMKDYLDGNPLIQTWHPRTIGIAARQAWGTDQSSWKTARNIEQWVFAEVDKKGFGTGFASATETLDSREGDCSEHAVLMAAMTRAVSIPAKLVSGLTYFQGEFLYHMWVEVWTGDGWYALDPTIGDGSVDAMHVKFGESSAKNGNVSDLALGILRVFSRLKIRIVEYTEGDQVIRP
ncbi:transglutaminase domain-containing protein [bacterium]|nr:transglutaminase domain-containing protein [bacterium]